MRGSAFPTRATSATSGVVMCTTSCRESTGRMTARDANSPCGLPEPGNGEVPNLLAQLLVSHIGEGIANRTDQIGVADLRVLDDGVHRAVSKALGHDTIVPPG